MLTSFSGICSRWRRAGNGALRLRIFALAILTCLALGACATAGGGKAGASSSSSPAERASAAGVGFAQVTVAVPSGNGAPPFNVAHTLTVPAGWSATVWARVPEVRFAAFTPQHDLLVSASAAGEVIELIPGRAGAPARQRVILWASPDRRGWPSTRSRACACCTSPSSTGSTATCGSAQAYPARARSSANNLPNLDPNGDDVHQSKSLAIGRDHTIYVTAGSGSNASPVPPGESPPRATILSVRPNGSGLRVFASGVRNGEGLSIAPDGSLWTAVNERDEIPYPFHGAFESQAEAFGVVIPAYVDEHPPDEVARLTAGRNLGWPYCDPDPDVTPGAAGTALRFANMPFTADVQANPGGRVMDCSKLAPIQRGLPAHSAPLGFHFLEGSAIAAPWSNGAVVAVHGSWDRMPPRAPAVLWMPWEARQRTLGESRPLVSGFQLPSGERWGRAVDAVPGPEGALYVTDDLAGAVYRIGPPER